MNTKKSRKFTSKNKAEKAARKRKKSVYRAGKNKCGETIYYVGEYKDVQKIAKKLK